MAAHQALLSLVFSTQYSIVFMYHMFFYPLICAFQKNGTDEPLCRAGIEMQMQRTDMGTWGQGEWGGGINWEIGIEIYSLPFVR